MRKYILILLTLFIILGCKENRLKNSLKGEVVQVKVTSNALSKNLVNEKSEQLVSIYLPPSYRSSNKKYPVIYFLPGFSGSNRNLRLQQESINEVFNKYDSKEFIIVEPTGYSSLGGSFYTNSPITGNWEDFISNELINYVDSNYRSVATKEGRGIAGHSMGGYGALNIALKFPEKYNAVYAISAGILKDGELNLLMESWGTDMRLFHSYGAVASPNLQLDYPHCEIPNSTYKDKVENRRVIDNWYKIYGNFGNKVKLFKEKNIPISGLAIKVGKNDEYSWIISGNKDLHTILKRYDIKHKYYKTKEGHALSSDIFYETLLPFFKKHL